MDPISPSTFHLPPPIPTIPPPSSPPSASGDNPTQLPTVSPRQAAIATLKRAASNREAPPPSNTPPSPSSSSTTASSTSSRLKNPRSRSRAYTSTRSSSTEQYGRTGVDEEVEEGETSLFLNPPGVSQLERTASLLARQLAMAKLTGTTLPTPPKSFFERNEPLPTLEDLQRRARAKLEAKTIGGNTMNGVGGGSTTLRRNHTVNVNQTTSSSDSTTTTLRPRDLASTNSIDQSTSSSRLPPFLKRNNTVTGIGVLTGSSGVSNAVELEESIRFAQERLGQFQEMRMMRSNEDRAASAGQGGGGGGADGREVETERSQARVNLMRKLSGRRLASPSAHTISQQQQQQQQAMESAVGDRLAVVGRIGRARPRSGSFGGIDVQARRDLAARFGVTSDEGEAIGGQSVGIGITMGNERSDGRTTMARQESIERRAESPETQRSSVSTTNGQGRRARGNETSSSSEAEGDVGEDSEEGGTDHAPWEFEQALEGNSASGTTPIAPPLAQGRFERRPESELETVRDSQHVPPPAPSSPSNENTPIAPWAPAFLSYPLSSQPSSTKTLQTAKFPAPVQNPARFSTDFEDKDAVSPNSSPQYPGPDWPTSNTASFRQQRPHPVVSRDFNTNANATERRPSKNEREFSNSSDLQPGFPPSGLSSAVVSPSPSSTSISSSASEHPSLILSPVSPDTPPPNAAAFQSHHQASRLQPHVPTFGIAAVDGDRNGSNLLGGGSSGFFGREDPNARKRGSSASSSLAWLSENSKRMNSRGSDAALLLNNGRGSLSSTTGFPNLRGRMGSAVSDSRSSSEGGGSDSRLGPQAEGDEEVLTSAERNEEEEGRENREMENLTTPNGAFPPPQAGYQFPAPKAEVQGLEQEETGHSKQARDLFEQLGKGTSSPVIDSPTASPSLPTPSQRKIREFPFKLPFQPPTFPETPSDSPILPDPISPTSVIADPFLSLQLAPPHHVGPGEGMERQVSARSSRTVMAPRSPPKIPEPPLSQSMVKSPSLESTTSSAGGNSSTYHSPVAMRRDLSSNSASSQDSTYKLLSPRVAPLPLEQLPANRILAKLDSILGTEALFSPSPDPSPLDEPPRKLLLHTPVLQVVNANTVKDRYLFLFTDLLIIAKPLIADHPLTGEPIQPTLENQFLVKSVVELRQLKISASEDPVEDSSSSSSTKKRHPLLVAFIDRFANEPARAIASLVQKGGLTNDGPTISNFLFKNTDLNRNQLGAYLANPNHRNVLRSYIERFRFGGVRIDDALRLFLMSVRLPPQDRKAAEYVLGTLASVWTETNLSSGFDPSLAFSLIVAILRLSDALHSSGERDSSEASILPSSRGTQGLSVDDFIGRFREHDTRLVVPEDLLSRIYTSIRRERIEQASDNSIFSMTPDIEATIEPVKLPTHLTYRCASEAFTITIPAPDTKFSIKLAGPDLVFDPPVLSFARSATQSFRVTGTALGVRVMVLIKRGANAPRYQGLPLNKAFSIERAFMQNTFQAAFTNHLGVKRKYMFSVANPSIRSLWLSAFRSHIGRALAQSSPTSPSLAAAQAVSTQVLRDVFLPPDEPLIVPAAAPSPRPNLAAPRFGPPVTAVPPRTRLGTPTRGGGAGGAFARSNSISKMYASQFKQEADLSDQRKQSLINGQVRPNGINGKDEVALLGSSPFAKTGRELVLTTEQNSLLPLVLSFLNTGLEAAPHPLSLQGSAFQLPPLPPSSSAPPTSTSIFPFVGDPFSR